MSPALRRHWPWLLALSATGLAAHLAFARGWTPATALDQLAARIATEAGAPAGPAPGLISGPPATPPLAELPCFRCHSYARYWDGARFKHADHTGAGHCHTCHAFEGHHQVPLRSVHCDACHAEPGPAAPLPQERPARGPFLQ